MKNKKNILFFCFIVSFLGLLICTKSSPLYPFNDWVDANAFFTVGKGMFNHLIPYKDLFEQKGPLLYLLYGFGYLISHKDFFGVFVLEVISFTLVLYFNSKTIKLFLKEKYIYIIIPIFTSIILTTRFFTHGGSAEEFAFLPLSISLYYILRYFKNNENIKFMNYTNIFLNGLMAGCIAMIKYTMLGFWFAFMMCVFFSFILKKEYRRAFISCFVFLLGMFLPIVLFALYFILNNGFKEFIETYFLINITSYSHTATLLDRFIKVLLILLKRMFTDFYILIFIVLGMFYFLFDSTVLKNRMGRFTVFCLLFFLCLGTYIGGVDYKYYFLIITFFILIGIIALFIVLDNLKKCDRHYSKIVIIILVLCFLNLFRSPNIYFMQYSREDLVQYKFADIINKKENPTLLNYAFLDGGFYTASDVLPNTRYFMRQNIGYDRLPELYVEQDNAIRSAKVDFVILREGPTVENEYLTTGYLRKNYVLVSEMAQKFEGKIYIYYLYQLKES